MAKPVVLVDADGVLFNFTEAYLAQVEIVTGEHHEVEEVTSWHIHEQDFFKRLVREFPDLKKLVELKVLRPGFVEGIAVLPGAKKGLSALQAVADVYIVTSPWHSSPTWMSERTDALYTHFGIPAKNVVHTSSKHVVHGNMLIDDKIENLTGWKHGLPVLWDQHHNRGVPPQGILRTSDWRDVCRIAGSS